MKGTYILPLFWSVQTSGTNDFSFGVYLRVYNFYAVLLNKRIKLRYIRNGGLSLYLRNYRFSHRHEDQFSAQDSS